LGNRINDTARQMIFAEFEEMPSLTFHSTIRNGSCNKKIEGMI
jgi:hypothetical protein